MSRLVQTINNLCNENYIHPELENALTTLLPLNTVKYMHIPAPIYCSLIDDTICIRWEEYILYITSYEASLHVIQDNYSVLIEDGQYSVDNGPDRLLDALNLIIR